MLFGVTVPFTVTVPAAPPEPNTASLESDQVVQPTLLLYQ